jgi:hypothetical protein
VLLGGKVHVVGGYNFGGGSRDVQVIEPATGTVSAGPSMFATRYSTATAVAGGRLYVMGGTVAGSSSPSSSVAVADALSERGRARLGRRSRPSFTGSDCRAVRPSVGGDRRFSTRFGL